MLSLSGLTLKAPPPLQDHELVPGLQQTLKEQLEQRQKGQVRAYRPKPPLRDPRYQPSVVLYQQKEEEMARVQVPVPVSLSPHYIWSGADVACGVTRGCCERGTGRTKLW